MSREWDGRIEDLPRELLSRGVRALSESSLLHLQDLAGRLSARGGAGDAGGWERLARALGFGSHVDRLSEQAWRGKRCPGAELLREWGGRPGSTAFVLLHALREAGREDLVRLLAGRLLAMTARSTARDNPSSMLLLVSVEDRHGTGRFLHVRTRKDAPLHASLDNELQAEVYMYDITGPWPGLDWCTPSGQLQGAQLSLKLRDKPCLMSKNQIYGIQPHQGCQPTKESPLKTHGSHRSPGGAPRSGPATLLPGGHVNAARVVRVTPPVQPRVSVMVDVLDSNKLNVKAENTNIHLVNDLSSKRLSARQQTKETGYQFSDNLDNGKVHSNLSAVGDDGPQTPCKPQAAERSPEREEKVSNVLCLGHAHLSLQSGFSPFSSLSAAPGDDDDDECCFGTSLPTNIPPVDDADISITCLKEVCFSSETGIKTPFRFSSHTDTKQPFTDICGVSVDAHESERMKRSHGFESTNGRVEKDEKDTPGSHEDTFSSPVAVCIMHPDYVLPESVVENGKCGGTLSCSYDRESERQQHTTVIKLEKSSASFSTRLVHARCSRGRSIVSSNGCSPVAVSTLHSEYLLPPDKIQAGCSLCRRTNSSETAMMQLSIKVHSKDRCTSESTNATAAVNNCREQSRQEPIPDEVFLAQHDLDKIRPDISSPLPSQPRGCAVHDVPVLAASSSSSEGTGQTTACFVGHTQTSVTTTKPVACFVDDAPTSGKDFQSIYSVVDQGLSSRNATQTPASLCNSAESGRCTSQPDRSQMKQTSSAGIFHVSTLHVNQTSTERRTVQPGSTSVNHTPSVKHTARPRDKCASQPGPVLCRQGAPHVSCVVVTPEGSHSPPVCSEQEPTALCSNSLAPALDKDQPKQTSSWTAWNNSKTTASSSLLTENWNKKHADSMPGTDYKGRGPKPSPCPYTYNIFPGISECASPKLSSRRFGFFALPLVSSSKASTIMGWPHVNASLPEERAPATWSPQSSSDSVCSDSRRPVSSPDGVFPPDSVEEQSECKDTNRELGNGGCLYTDPTINLENNPPDNLAVPGWNPNVTNRMVVQELMKHVKEDGHFIVWRSALKRQYVISVSYRRHTRHYRIHEEKVQGQTRFSIHPESAPFTSLSGLVAHCQRFGILEQAKSVVSQDGKKQSFFVVRPLHVRLKTPVSASVSRC